MSNLKPGKYLILDPFDSTQCMEDFDTEIRVSERGDQESQRWYLLPDSEGYLVKNCNSGGYFANYEEIDMIQYSIPTCGKLATVWSFDEYGEEDEKDVYVMRRQDFNHVVQSNSLGKLYMVNPNEGQFIFGWRLEFLSDDTGGVGQTETIKANGTSDTIQQQTPERDTQITELNAQVARIQRQLTEKSELLKKTERALQETRETLASREVEIMQLRKLREERKAKDELAQQKEDMANLQARVRVLERVVNTLLPSEEKFNRPTG